MKEVVIVEAVRSAVGKGNKGSLAFKRPEDLAGEVISGLLSKTPSVRPEMVEDLVLGCAMPEGEQGLNIARIACFLGGLPQETSAVTVNRFCASGLQAVFMAANGITMGNHEIVIAGGVESMSMVPMTGNKISASFDAMAKFPEVYTPMGITAENVAKKYGISREMQDQFALWSQKKAAKAIENRIFEDEITPVMAIKYEGNERRTFEFRRDELVRPDTTLEGLSSLKPAFAADGSVTAGNSSPISDGAAAVLLMTQEKAKEHGLKGLAYPRMFVTVGVEPALMGIGPIFAIRKLLSKTGLSLNDIDLFEINEAFASQCVYVQHELNIPDEKLNVHGGAIALGHPLGCTGAKLTATILHELRRRKARYGVVSMCVGGGMGAAGLFEMLR